MKILTFDLEEWFHIMDNEYLSNVEIWDSFEYRLEKNLDRILKYLNSKNLKATFFCLGWIADKYPELIRKINEKGHEIGSHSFSHKLAYEQNKKDFENDLERSIKILEDLTGKKVTSYRAPGFSIKEENIWVFELLTKYGIEKDSSIFPARRAHGGLEKFEYSEPFMIDVDGLKIKEFPVNVFKIFNKKIVYTGGGYFRIMPYFFTKIFSKKSDYVMTYFHPRDFDKNQPILNELSLYRRFKSYVGLKGSFKKFKKYIHDFHFIDLCSADKKIDWNLKKIINYKNIK